MRRIAFLLCALDAALPAQPAVSLAQRLAETAVTQLRSGNPEAVASGLAIATALAEDATSFDTVKAIEDVDLRSVVESVSRISKLDTARRNATASLAAIDRRLGLDRIETASELTSNRSTVLPAAAPRQYRWAYFRANADEEYNVRLFDCAVADLTFFAGDRTRVLGRGRGVGSMSTALGSPPQVVYIRIFATTTACSREQTISLAARIRPREVSASADFRQAPQLEVGRVYRLAIATDSGRAPRWIRFDAVRGGHYVIETSRLDLDVDVALSLYESNGTTLLGDDGGSDSNASRLKWVAERDGPYLLKVTSFDGAGKCDISILQTGVLPIGSDWRASGQLDKAAVVNSSNELHVVRFPEDAKKEGWFRLATEPGKAYSARATTSVTVRNPKGEPVLGVEGLPTTVDETRFRGISFIAEASEYQLRVTPGQGKGNVWVLFSRVAQNTQFKTVTLTASAESSEPIALSDYYVSSISAQAPHFARFEAQNGHRFRVVLQSIGLRRRANVEILDSTGTPLWTGSSTAPARLLPWVAPQSGNYFLRFTSTDGVNSGVIFALERIAP